MALSLEGMKSISSMVRRAASPTAITSLPPLEPSPRNVVAVVVVVRRESAEDQKDATERLECVRRPFMM